MILIRADANETIGVGHVMRCLSIAHALSAKGEKVRFVTADHSSDRLIAQGGFQTICLDTEWANMQRELPVLVKLIQSLGPKLLLVDSYYVTERYFATLSSYIPLAYIDDLNGAPLDVDWLINYNIFSSIFDYSWYGGTRTKLLLQPQYAPLRDEFRNLPEPTIKSQVTDILVSAGGSDPQGITEQLMDLLCPHWGNIHFHFVVGALNPRKQAIVNSAKDNAILHINARNMSSLMMSCDLAIAAAGSTLYELCACGIPTVTYTLADNQLLAAEQFALDGLMLNAGDCRSRQAFLDAVGNGMDALLTDRERRVVLSRAMRALVDGNGAYRIAEKFLQSPDAY